MSHNIEVRSGRASIVYAGETPWHRLGQPLKEAFDAETALKLGGLNFKVEKVGLKTVDNQNVPNQFAIRRTDSKDVLGVCGSTYAPLQNVDAFGFFDGIFGKGKARYEVAGVLGKGEKVWMLAKLPGDFQVVGHDTVGKWLLLMNAHDGHGPVRAKFTPIRVVCQNTLNAALRGTENEVRVMHVGDMATRMKVAGELLKKAGLFFDDVQEVFRGFTRKALTTKAIRAYASRVVAGDGVKDDELTSKARESITEIEELHERGRGADIKSVRGTLWGAYNAVTEWVDHKRTGDDIAYLAKGRGLQIKERAFEVAQELIVGAN